MQVPKSALMPKLKAYTYWLRDRSMFWGQLHIKYPLVKERHRGQGIGRELVKHAFEYGKEQGCDFTYVETMSFQAINFYKKLGFKVELQRDGYSHKTSFYYLRKDLL
jgi:ribosomal protein S18 acetylase RimI-like enzyme